ncbi:MAG: Pr6Pr family membrane protein [Chitinophagaceae bacterium]
MKNNAAAEKTGMIIIALVAWVGIILQFYLILQTTVETGYSSVKLTINFFSYFTILSNLLIAVCLSAVLLSPRSRIGRFFSKIPVQSAIAVYIFIVGLVYNLVLRGIVILNGLNWIVDNILHVLVPVLYVLYWFIFTPKKSLHWKNILPWLIFPGLYLVYSLIRGPLAHWYPYPFLNSEKLGLQKVIVNSCFVLTAFLVISLLLIAYNRSAKRL